MSKNKGHFCNLQLNWKQTIQTNTKLLKTEPKLNLIVDSVAETNTTLKFDLINDYAHEKHKLWTAIYNLKVKFN